MSALHFYHVDVFSPRPYSGNSLAVFINAGDLSAAQMQAITCELRHFESIFLTPTPDPRALHARVFDLFEELPFAGHPIIGAAAVLHSLAKSSTEEHWSFQLPQKTVTITTTPKGAAFFGMLNQGRPEFFDIVSTLDQIAHSFALDREDLRADLPAQVVSTGLRYLVIPVVAGALDKARVTTDLTPILRSVGAQFAVLLDETALEIRHWNNDGVVEDIATGSAAGCIGAYRLRHALATSGQPFVLEQGRFVGRPSRLEVVAEGSPSDVRSVQVGGDAVIIGHGTLIQPP